ncbi:MAG: GNAT family N-acetyltransferase [Methanomicrobiales archaeon]
MFRSVLLPTDLSPYSMATVRSLSYVGGVGDVYLLHARDPALQEKGGWISNLLREHRIAEEQEDFEEEVQALIDAGLRVHPEVTTAPDGDAAGSIVQAADAADVDLVMMGARGYGFLVTRFLGSVSSEVLRRVNRSVLIMHFPHGREGVEPLSSSIFSRVCIPTDFSKPTEALIAQAGGTGRIGSAILVHVVKENHPKDLEDRRDQLDELAEILQKQGVCTETRMEHGDPTDVILQVAREEDVNLILMPRCGEKDYTTNIPLGSVTADVARHADRPVLVHIPVYYMVIDIRALTPDEYPLAEKLWEHYHQQTVDPGRDRVFGVFVEDRLTSVARCRRHPDGLEVDAVYTPERYRGKGHARRAVAALVEECGDEPLFMHSTLELVDFYGSFGFYPIPEDELPPRIRDRFRFALGDMEAMEVQPMRRDPGRE